MPPRASAGARESSAAYGLASSSHGGGGGYASTSGTTGLHTDDDQVDPILPPSSSSSAAHPHPSSQQSGPGPTSVQRGEVPDVAYMYAPMHQIVQGRENIEYQLTIREQPKHSRMCGIGEKADRRPIDPAPIIQLRVIVHDHPIAPPLAHTPAFGGSDPTRPPDSSLSAASMLQRGVKVTTAYGQGWEDKAWYLDNPYYFMYAMLADVDTDEELHLLPDGKTRYTTGSCVSCLYHLKDIDGSHQGFFVFPDLSIRVEGRYKLKLCLFETLGHGVHHCKSIFTAPFNVYTAKRFPGMEESTALSRSFAEQGLKVRVRKHPRLRKGKRGSDDSEGGESDQRGDGSSAKRIRSDDHGGIPPSIYSQSAPTMHAYPVQQHPGRQQYAQDPRAGGAMLPAPVRYDQGRGPADYPPGAYPRDGPGYDQGYDRTRFMQQQQPQHGYAEDPRFRVSNHSPPSALSQQQRYPEAPGQQALLPLPVYDRGGGEAGPSGYRNAPPAPPGGQPYGTSPTDGGRPMQPDGGQDGRARYGDAAAARPISAHADYEYGRLVYVGGTPRQGGPPGPATYPQVLSDVSGKQYGYQGAPPSVPPPPQRPQGNVERSGSYRASPPPHQHRYEPVQASDAALRTLAERASASAPYPRPGYYDRPTLPPLHSLPQQGGTGGTGTPGSHTPANSTPSAGLRGYEDESPSRYSDEQYRRTVGGLPPPQYAPGGQQTFFPNHPPPQQQQRSDQPQHQPQHQQQPPPPPAATQYHYSDVQHRSPPPGQERSYR